MTAAQWPTVDRRSAAQMAEDIAQAPVHPDETLYERRMQALSLRNAGMTITDISRTHKVSTMTTRKDIEWAKREVMSASMEDIIATQRAVIHDLRRAAYPTALNPKNPEDQARAQGKIIDGLVHEAKLVGAFAPMRTLGVPSDTEFAERFVELVSAINPATLKELTRGHFNAHPTIEQHPDPDDQLDAASAGTADRSADAANPDGPVDADVVELPQPVDQRTIEVAKLGQCRCGTPGCGSEHEIRPDPELGDDWSNI